MLRAEEEGKEHKELVGKCAQLAVVQELYVPFAASQLVLIDEQASAPDAVHAEATATPAEVTHL